MKFFICLLSLYLAAALGHAATVDKRKKIDLRPTPAKTDDPGSATSLIYDTKGVKDGLPEKDETGKLKVTATCTDSMGMVQKKGDKGYDTCLRNLDRLKPEPTNYEKNPRSVGISIGN